MKAFLAALAIIVSTPAAAERFNPLTATELDGATLYYELQVTYCPTPWEWDPKTAFYYDQFRKRIFSPDASPHDVGDSISLAERLVELAAHKCNAETLPIFMTPGQCIGHGCAYEAAQFQQSTPSLAGWHVGLIRLILREESMISMGNIGQ